MSSELSGFATKKTKEKKNILVFSHFDFAALLLYSLYFFSSAAAADSHIQQTPYTSFSALFPFSLSRFFYIASVRAVRSGGRSCGSDTFKFSVYIPELALIDRRRRRKKRKFTNSTELDFVIIISPLAERARLLYERHILAASLTVEGGEKIFCVFESSAAALFRCVVCCVRSSTSTYIYHSVGELEKKYMRECENSRTTTERCGEYDEK